MNECSACSAETRVFACKSWLRAELEEEYTASFWSGAAKRDRPLKERRDVPVSGKKNPPALLCCFGFGTTLWYGVLFVDEEDLIVRHSLF